MFVKISHQIKGQVAGPLTPDSQYMCVYFYIQHSTPLWYVDQPVLLSNSELGVSYFGVPSV